VALPLVNIGEQGASENKRELYTCLAVDLCVASVGTVAHSLIPQPVTAHVAACGGEIGKP
jgi:hypothetical protein